MENQGPSWSLASPRAAIWSGASYAVSVDGDTRREDSAWLFERG